MPIDKKTNKSYVYLASKKSKWLFNPEEINSRLLERMEKRFAVFDKDGDDNLTIEEVEQLKSLVRKELHATPEQMKTLKSAIRTFFEEIGVDEKGLNGNDWIEALMAFNAAEEERSRHNEKTVASLLGDAYFDILDTNKDNDISREEMKKMMMPNTSSLFNDANNGEGGGKVTRKELTAYVKQMWLM